MNDSLKLAVLFVTVTTIACGLVVCTIATLNKLDADHVERMKELGYVQVAEPVAWSYKWIPKTGGGK